MKHLIWILMLCSSVSFAQFKHESDKELAAFFKDFILNPDKQNVPKGQKYGPFKPGIMADIKASPVKRRHFAVGMARLYLFDHIAGRYPEFEKKFGKMDDAKDKKIWGIVLESVYAEKDDVITKMVDDQNFRLEVYKTKLDNVLKLKSLK
ncbi:MAG: hypothetical protein LW878_10705 [Proteobacteria bacterium]|nr:hypothetical protein [Pseudomonadota bacterium]